MATFKQSRQLCEIGTEGLLSAACPPRTNVLNAACVYPPAQQGGRGHRPRQAHNILCCCPPAAPMVSSKNTHSGIGFSTAIAPCARQSHSISFPPPGIGIHGPHLEHWHQLTPCCGSLQSCSRGSTYKPYLSIPHCSAAFNIALLYTWTKLLHRPTPRLFVCRARVPVGPHV